MTAGKLSISIGVVLVLGFAIIFGAAAWSQNDHHGHGHQGQDAGGMHGRAGQTGDHSEAMHEQQHADAHHGMDAEMGEHHESHDHHDMEARKLDTADLEPTGALKDGVRVITMKARQFEFDPSTVVVNQGETVRLEVTSQDVTHGIDIEGYDIDKRLPPDTKVTITFAAEKAGQHLFHCSVFCGKDHDEMLGTLVVLEPGKDGQ